MNTYHLGFFAVVGLALAAPSMASDHLTADVDASGTTWIYASPDAKDVPFTEPPLWIVTCAGDHVRCFARHGSFVLWIDPTGSIHADILPRPTWTLKLSIPPVSYPMGNMLGPALSDLWLSRFLDPEASILIETDGVIVDNWDLDGLSAALERLVELANAEAPPAGILSALKDAADYAQDPKAQPVPAVKPQVMFAINAQRPPSQ